MERFSDPVAAIQYLAQSARARDDPAKFTYRELAKRVGVDYVTIWRTATGRTSPTPIVAARLKRLATDRFRKRRRAKQNGA